MSLTFDSTLKKTLGDELLDCQIFRTPENRQGVLNDLPYGQRVLFSAQANIHARNIIDSALDWPRGLEMLIDAIYFFEQESLAMKDVFNVLDRASPQPVRWEHVARLKEILNAEKFDDELLIRLCGENSPAAPPLPSNAEGHDLLSACAEVLARWPHPSGDDAPLLTFLYTLLPSVRGSKSRDECVRWMKAVARELGIDLQAVKASARQKAAGAATAEQGIPYMLVTIQRDDFDPDNEIWIKGWLYHGGGYKQLEVDAGPHTHDKLPLLMRQLIFDSQSKLLKEAGRPMAEASKLIIELFLPVNLLGSEIDQWTVQLGKWAVASPLERHYLVVVRSYERVYDEDVRAFSWGPWQDKWNRRPVLPQMLTQANVYLASEPSDYTNSFYDKLALAQFNLFFLGLTPIPPPDAGLNATDIFGPLIQAGTPVAIWLRRRGADMSAVRAELEDLIYKNDLDSIPHLIYQRRRELWDEAASSVWKSVSLLWDDPDRLPPDVLEDAELQAPKAHKE